MQTSYYLTQNGKLYRSTIDPAGKAPRGEERRRSGSVSQKRRKSEGYGLWQIAVDILGTLAIVSLCATFWLQMWLL